MLSLLDSCDRPVLDYERVRRWPPGQLDRFVELGLLSKGDMAAGIFHSGCAGGCSIDYYPERHPKTGEMIVTHWCRRGGGLVVLGLEHFQLWDIRLDGLAHLLAASLELTGRAESLLDNRLFRLGTLLNAPGPIDVFLASGLREKGAAAITSEAPRLGVSPAPVVLVPTFPPAVSPWPDVRPKFIALSGVLAWDNEAATVDTTDLALILHSIHPATPAANWLTVRECAELLLKDVSGLDIKKATARVSWAAGAGKFRTNGKKGAGRRIEHDSFSAWRIEQRERDLDASDW